MPKYNVEITHIIRRVTQYPVTAANPDEARGKVRKELAAGEFGKPTLTIKGEKAPKCTWKDVQVETDITDCNEVVPPVKPAKK